jgi:hypothetical protein
MLRFPQKSKSGIRSSHGFQVPISGNSQWPTIRHHKIHLWVGLLKRPDETNPKEICARRAADVAVLIVMSSRTRDPLTLGTFGLETS